MLGRLMAAVAVVIGAVTAAGAQEVTWPGVDFGRYHALVIGNNAYRHLPKLATAVDDAEAVATLLRESYGFKVTKLVNATRRDITGAFNDLRKTLTEADNLLVYYAGHGILDEEADRGYWLPVDARRDDDSEWFSNGRLTGYLKAMSARHVMVIADSCYAGNLTRGASTTLHSGVARGAWIQRMNAKRSRTALTSGGLEPVLDRGGGAHSVFAGALLAALAENPGLMFGTELFDRVKGVVVANADQTPEYADIRYTGHEKGDFLFVPRGVKFEAAGGEPAAPDREALFWQSIQASRDPADFAAYLEAFPDGTFAPLARRRIAAAAAPADLALAAPPQRLAPRPGPPPSKPGERFRDCADCPEMVVIPAGRFTMGSPADEAGRNGDEAPRHLVTIGRAFALGRTEVTFAEWDACAEAGGCGERPDDAGWGRGRRPVLNVSWDDARDYVTWLSRRTGASYRLPSESEWEYAARAGTETARYWGEAPGRACSFANVHDRTSKSENGYDWTHHACDDGHATTAPVGSFDANGFGLYDVLGNLWEWTQDCWNRDYGGAPADQAARDSGDCGSHVVRGGPWSLAPWDVRSAARRKVGAIVRNTVIGFRVARTL